MLLIEIHPLVSDLYKLAHVFWRFETFCCVVCIYWQLPVLSFAAGIIKNESETLFMDFMKTLAVVVVAAIVMYTLIGGLKRRKYRTLVSCLEQGNYDAFYKDLDKTSTKLLFPKLSLLDLRLNAAMIRQNKKETAKLLEEISCMPLTPKQKESFYMKAFNYFVGLGDAKMSRKYRDLINALPNERMKFEVNRVYNIFILKNDQDLGDLLEELNAMEENEKGINEYLVSVIYKNKKDAANQKKYEELSRKHFAAVDEMTAQKMKELGQ